MKIIINSNSMIPIYEQIMDAIKKMIMTKELKDNDPLPSMRTLSKELKISALTVKKAYDNLEAEGFTATVRPPRLGGNTRMGVFATRSPFRPNPIGLSSVRLERIENTAADGPVLIISGADLMNGTPIYDIKPYLPYADCQPEATGGFTDRTEKRKVSVDIPEDVAAGICAEELEALKAVLEQDPRPAYQDEPERVYAFEFGGRHVEFKVTDGVLSVLKA